MDQGRSGRREARAAMGLIALATALVTREGSADVRTYRAEALREDFRVEAWFGACGPPPVSRSDGEWALVQVTEDGGELVVREDGGRWGTATCLEPAPTLEVRSHEASPSPAAWRTSCAS